MIKFVLTFRNSFDEIVLRADHYVLTEGPHSAEHVDDGFRDDEEYFGKEKWRHVSPGVNVRYRAFGAPVDQRDHNKDD